MAEISQCGTKRKRHEVDKEDVALKIAGKLYHDIKGVRKAAKKAKAFEMQKLLKKLKGLRGKGEYLKEVTEFEAQLDALKRTDSDLVANTALITKFKKDRVLSGNTFLQTSISSQLSTNLLSPAEAGSPLSKVQSRLLSSKVLASEVTAVVNDLKFTLEARSRSTVKETGNNGETCDRDEPRELRKKTKVNVALATDEVSSGAELAEEFKDEDGVDSSAANEVDSSADDGWESGSVLSGHDMAHDNKMSSNSDSGSEEDSDDGNGKPGLQPVRKVSNTKRASAAESTFLPALSVGFVRGDSGSEWSDSEAKAADIRKNRRGQRARRAIWEKKYGNNANHKKKQRETMQTSGRGQLSGAAPKIRERKTNRGGRAQVELTSEYDQVDTGSRRKLYSSSLANPVRVSGSQLPPHQEERGLHPSWEAKRKQKEQQSGIILPAQGTKIKFY